MIYFAGAVGLAFAIAFIAVFCFVWDRALGRILFYWFYALHLASDRERFVRGYRYFSRAVGAVMICGIIVGLALRAFD